MKKIVVVGGGTGTFTVLSALKSFPDIHLSAIVSMMDDGGSTGILRDEYGVLPPGDIRRALVALSESSDTLRSLFNYRFEGGGLSGHSFGNLFLAALEKTTGSFEKAVEEASEILKVRGRVIPVTMDNCRLVARLADGSTVYGESRIDIPKSERAPIVDMDIDPEAIGNPEACRAIIEADLVIVGPGDIYTSIVPNFLVKGVPEAMKLCKGERVYVGNIMTKRGETDGYSAARMITAVERFAGEGIFSFSLWNSSRPSSEILDRYKEEGASFIEPPEGDSISSSKPIILPFAKEGELFRHDPEGNLGPALISLLP